MDYTKQLPVNSYQLIIRCSGDELKTSKEKLLMFYSFQGDGHLNQTLASNQIGYRSLLTGYWLLFL
jgi:hypothetical protein